MLRTTCRVALLLALLVGCGLGILFASATVLVQVNQALCSLALTIGGIGVANAIGRNFTGLPIPAVFQPLPIPLLRNVPLLGPILFEQNVLVYAVYLGLPCLLHLLYFNTRHGLDVRAVGESPSAADASGVAVTRIGTWLTVRRGTRVSVQTALRSSVRTSSSRCSATFRDSGSP